MESVKQPDIAGKKSISRWTPLTRAMLLVFTLATLALRMYRVSEPQQVVFDEVHFGGFASHYLKGTYFFDVHPPLGKLIIAGIGHFYGYKGTFAFKDISDPYADDPTVPFVQMRSAMVAFGTCSVMFALGTLVEMGFSPLALILAGTFLSFGKNTYALYAFLLVR